MFFVFQINNAIDTFCYWTSILTASELSYFIHDFFASTNHLLIWNIMANAFFILLVYTYYVFFVNSLFGLFEQKMHVLKIYELITYDEFFVFELMLLQPVSIFWEHKHNSHSNGFHK